MVRLGGMAQVFEELGWADGASLSITSATVGLIWGHPQWHDPDQYCRTERLDPLFPR